MPISGTKSGRPSAITTPSTAVKAIAAATSSARAPITGATAAIAELPQMALPQATRIAMRAGRPRVRQIRKLPAMPMTTVPTMPISSVGPEARMAHRLSEAPSRRTATSSSCLAQNAIPECKRASSTQAVRTAMPIKIASTSAST